MFDGQVSHRVNLTVPLAVSTLAMIVAALLAGCASGQQAADRNNTATAHPTGSRLSSAIAGNEQRQAPTVRTMSPRYGTVALTTRTTAPAGTVSQPWTATRIGGNRVYLSARVPACSAKQYITLREAGNRITIGYWATPSPKRIACAPVGLSMFGFVQLSRLPSHRIAIEHVTAGHTAP